MKNKSPLIRMLICLVLSGLTRHGYADSPSLESPKIIKNENIESLDAILSGLNRVISKENVNSGEMLAEQSEWLKKLPEDEEKQRQSYVDRILSLLSKNPNFNSLKPLLTHNDLPYSPSLATKEKMTLLVLCLEIYAKKQGLALDCGYLNGELIQEGFNDYFLDHASQLYEIAPGKLLFLWCNGAGARNASYWVWLISFKEGVFQAKLLDAPVYNVKTKTLKKQPFINGQIQGYNAQNQFLTFNVSSANDKNEFVGIQHIYSIGENGLILEKQRYTKSYNAWKTQPESTTPALSSNLEEAPLSASPTWIEEYTSPRS